MMLRPNRSMIAGLALSSLPGIGSVPAHTAVSAPRIYGLDRDSAFQRGCLDTVIEVSASPVPPDQVRPYRLLPGSTFQHAAPRRKPGYRIPPPVLLLDP